MEQNPFLLSIHIPKCGGTSFRLWLEQLFGPRLYYDYSRQWAISDRGELMPLLSGKACFHAHANPDALDDSPLELRKLTWIRDPVDRVISYYFHLQRDADLNNSYFREVIEKRLSLLQFAELPWMRNGILSFLQWAPEQFDFIGVLEEEERSMQRLLQSELFSALKARQSLPFVNAIAPDQQGERLGVDRATRERIQALNREDMDFYQQRREQLLSV